MFNINSYLERMREELKVRCPYCTYDVSNDSDSTEMYEIGIPITYYGHPEGEDAEINCSNCGENFKVRELVRRTFETKRINETFD